VHLDHGANGGVNAIYRALEKFSPEHEPPAVIEPGNKVAVLYNNQWCRGYVLACEDVEDEDGRGRMVKVRFVDFKEDQWLNPKEVKQLPPQVDKMPLTAFTVLTDPNTSSVAENFCDPFAVAENLCHPSENPAEKLCTEETFAEALKRVAKLKMKLYVRVTKAVEKSNVVNGDLMVKISGQHVSLYDGNILEYLN